MILSRKTRLFTLIDYSKTTDSNTWNTWHFEKYFNITNRVSSVSHLRLTYLFFHLFRSIVVRSEKKKNSVKNSDYTSLVRCWRVTICRKNFLYGCVQISFLHRVIESIKRLLKTNLWMFVWIFSIKITIFEQQHKSSEFKNFFCLSFLHTWCWKLMTKQNHWRKRILLLIGVNLIFTCV